MKMQLPCSPTLLFILLIILPAIMLAQAPKVPNNHTSLIARKDGKTKVYRPGTHIYIRYSTDSTEIYNRGYIKGSVDDKLIITQKLKSDQRIFINAEDILVIRKIRPGKRIFFASLGAILVGAGAAYANQASSGWAFVIVVPLIGAGSYMIMVTPVSLLLEKIAEKKVSKGWQFSLQNNTR
ncbi:MAG: hypothetical protein ABIT96_05980 [Ferruginibacter sp.]